MALSGCRVLRHVVRSLGGGPDARRRLLHSTATAAAATNNATPAPSPRQLLGELPLSAAAAATVHGSRQAIADVLAGEDNRLLVVVGPCSIHDVAAAEEYASRLLPLRRAHAAELEIVMRVYFEKPRTTVGWKGLINDPSYKNTRDLS